MRSAKAALASPINGRNSNTSTAPSRSPKTSMVPDVGCICAAANRMSVVLPAPFGPSTTHRSPSSTDQFTPSRIVLAPRRTVTSVRLSTSPISPQPSSPTVEVMSLDIPRSILAALWAPRLGEAPDPAEVAVAAQAVRGEADDDARGLTSAELLAQIAGTAVLAALPIPGDPIRLPAPARSPALDAGQVVISGPPGGAPGLLRVAVPQEQPFGSEWEPGELLSWQVLTDPVDGTSWVPPVVTLAEARTGLAEALNLAIETLTSMDVARWREDAAEEIAMLGSDELPAPLVNRIPPGIDSRRLHVLSRAVRLRAIVDLATQDDGAAVNSWQADQRTAALRHVATAARTALSAVTASGF